MTDQEMINKAWDYLNQIEASIQCECTLSPEPGNEWDVKNDLVCLYYKAKSFVRSVDEHAEAIYSRNI